MNTTDRFLHFIFYLFFVYLSLVTFFSKHYLFLRIYVLFHFTLHKNYKRKTIDIFILKGFE